MMKLLHSINRPFRLSLLWFAVMISIVPALASDYWSDNITGNLDSQIHGDAIYREGWGPFDVDINPWNHAAIFYYDPSTGTREVIELIGITDPIELNSFDDWKNDSIIYYGAHSNPIMTPADRNAIVDTAFDLWRNHNGHIIYTGLGQIDLDGINLNLISWDGNAWDIVNMRCDGFVEYCYEYNQVDVWGKNGQNFSIVQYPAEHNNAPDLASEPEPAVEVCPVVQRGGPGPVDGYIYPHYTKLRRSPGNGGISVINFNTSPSIVFSNNQANCSNNDYNIWGEFTLINTTQSSIIIQYLALAIHDKDFNHIADLRFPKSDDSECNPKVVENIILDWPGNRYDFQKAIEWKGSNSLGDYYLVINAMIEGTWRALQWRPFTIKLSTPDMNFTANARNAYSSTLALGAQKGVGRASAGNDLVYRIERSTNSVGPYEQVGTTRNFPYIDFGLEPDTTYYYRLRAQSWDGNSDYSNIDDTTTLSAGVCASDSVPPCGVIDKRWITSNISFRGECIDEPGDEEWLSFYAEAGDLVIFDAYPAPGSVVILQMAIYDASGCTYPDDVIVSDPDNNNPADQEAHISFLIPHTGKYQLKIRGYDNSTGEYRLEKQVVNDVGANQNALDITVGAGTTIHNEFINFNLDEDWYRFWADEGKVYTIKIQNLDDSMYHVPTGYFVLKPQMAIYADADGDQLMVRSPDNEILDYENAWIEGWVPPSSGYYYIKVRGWDDNTGYYRLEASAGQCYSLSYTSLSLTADAAMNAAVFVLLESPDCTSWNASTNDSWITITDITYGAGAAVVYFDVDSNPSTAARTGTIEIGSETFTVYQAGTAPCTYVVYPTSGVNVSVDGGTPTLTIYTEEDCAWSVEMPNPVDWVHYQTQGGTGDGSVALTVDANPTINTREVDIIVAGEQRTISQAAINCDNRYFFSYPGYSTFTSAGGEVIITVDAPGACPWTMSSNASWVELTYASGLGPGSFRAQFAPNTGTDARSERFYLLEDPPYNIHFLQAGTGDTPITVNLAGTGDGYVTDEGEYTTWYTSETKYSLKNSVELEAVPDTGSMFTGWSGDWTGLSTTCQLNLDESRSVTASFEPIPAGQTQILTVSKLGNGDLLSQPVGISCGSSCSSTSQTFSTGTPVTLFANSSSGHVTWGGECSGSEDTCTVSLAQDVSVCVVYEQMQPQDFTVPDPVLSDEEYQLTWSATSPINQYELQEYLDSTFLNATSIPVTGTSHSITHTVTSSTTFFYRVRAIGDCDGKEFYSAWSTTRSTQVDPDSGNDMPWTEVTPAASWNGRTGHQAVSFNNRLWVMGGFDTVNDDCNDIWSSENGFTWDEETSSASWSERNEHQLVVFNNKIWLLGGRLATGELYRDVWYSSNGVTFTRATAYASWSARARFQVVVYDNKMWVIGGYSDADHFLNDVWYSSNGSSWIRATAAAPWDGRYGHRALVYDNKIWVIGGSGTDNRYNDVWYSSDGVNWTEATSAAPWAERYYFGAVVHENEMWLLGGVDDGSNIRNDVWHSSDGITWTQATAAADWLPRANQATLIHDDRIWILGGYAGSYINDVWYSGTHPGSLIEVTINGLAYINEEDGAQYSATASWEYGATADVTLTGIWSDDSTYASIDSQGYLSTTNIPSQQTVNITAEYTFESVTESDTVAVTILDDCANPVAPIITASTDAIGGDDYQVQWTGTSPVIQYLIQEADNASFVDAEEFLVNDTSMTFAHSLAATTSYFYRVQALNDCDGDVHYSPWSNTDSTDIVPDVTFTQQFGADNPMDSFDVGHYASPAFVDMDGDLDYDIVTGAASGQFLYFQNVGTVESPVYVEQTGASNPLDQFATSRSAPTFADLDNDGDMDCVSGNFNGGFPYFENIGSATNAVFIERTGGNNPMPVIDVSRGECGPTFADLDNDGDLDFIVGWEPGTFRYYKNIGSASSPVFTERTGSANPLGSFDVAFYSYPVFVDLDGDGDLDCISGREGGTTQADFSYFKNTGTVSNPVFIEETEELNPLSEFSSGSTTALTMADLDSDGDVDCIAGYSSGTFCYYRNDTIYSAPVELEAVSISGPATVDDGESVQYTATAFWSDESSTDVTTTVIWSEDLAAASINTSGYLTATNLTEDESGTITASITFEEVTRVDTIDVTIVDTMDTVTGLVLSGPPTIEEGTGEQFAATLQWSDGGSTNVTVSASWIEDSPFASVSSIGHLMTTEVDADETMDLTAEFTYQSILYTDTITLTILNAPISQPVEVSPAGADTPLTFSNDTLSWEDGSVSGATAFNVYRGQLSTIASDYGTCLGNSITSSQFTDTEIPAAGEGYFYLVSGENLRGEGTLGNDSSGNQRSVSTNCP